MRGNWIRLLALPLLLAAGLGACASNGVPPGIVYTSGVPSGSGPGPSARIVWSTLARALAETARKKQGADHFAAA